MAQIDPRIAWSWVPSTFETSIKVGGGLVSPGYGFTIGSSGIFNLLPTNKYCNFSFKNKVRVGCVNQQKR